ncbi:MAG: tetratricopeptide repeat protein [Desulfobacterota bacterium]|nr:tetratricopeptide repeat protein [Thermodesulfobacteriota bacterium]
MLQRDIDKQGDAIRLLQQKTQELERSLRRLQTEYHNDTDRLNIEIESLKARIEESTRRNEKLIAEITAAAAKEPARLEQQEQLQKTEGQDVTVTPSDQISSTPASTPVASEKELFDQAYALYTNREYVAARKKFQEFMQRYPSSNKTDSALYWIAQCYYKEKKFEDAIAACDDVIKKFPKGSKTADAYYLQALAFCEIQDPLTAQILLETLMQNFPNSEAAKLGKKKYDELKAGTP